MGKTAIYTFILFLLILVRFTGMPIPTELDWINEFPFIHFMNLLILILTLYLGIYLLKLIYRKRKRMKRNQIDNVIVGLDNIYYLLLAGAVLITLPTFFGIDFISFFTSLSIVAAAIAIISKEFIQDIISGIIISFSNAIGIDDFVRIGEHKGKIIDINIHKITLLNEDDDIIFLPNYKVYTSEIINYTRKEIKKVNIEFEIGAAQLTSIEDLEEALASSIEEYHASIEPGSFNIRIVRILKDVLVLKFQFVLLQIDRDLEREIRKKTVRRVVEYRNDFDK